MFNRIKNVKPLSDMVLYIEFFDGSIKHYDVKPLLNKWETFKDLTQNDLFKLVKIDTGGYAVIWNDYIDLSCNELYNNGINV